jgi:hypothetical protein
MDLNVAHAFRTSWIVATLQALPYQMALRQAVLFADWLQPAAGNVQHSVGMLGCALNAATGLFAS